MGGGGDFCDTRYLQALLKYLNISVVYNMYSSMIKIKSCDDWWRYQCMNKDSLIIFHHVIEPQHVWTPHHIAEQSVRFATVSCLCGVISSYVARTLSSPFPWLNTKSNRNFVKELRASLQIRDFLFAGSSHVSRQTSLWHLFPSLVQKLFWLRSLLGRLNRPWKNRSGFRFFLEHKYVLL